MRGLLVILALLASGPALALITGPTTSTGQFTLSWSATGYLSYSEYLVDESTGQYHLQSPTAFTKSNGTYLFTQWVCVADLSVPIVECFPIDTHTVAVDTSAPPPPAPQHVVTYGDFTGDGLIDAAVVAPNPANRLVDDFILRNTGGGTLAVLASPTSGQIAAARAAPGTTATALVADLTLDRKLDVIVKGLDAVIAGAPERQAVWSQVASPAAHPTAAVRITDTQIEFLAETAGALADPNFYANAITQQCITQTGWYIFNNVLVTTPGWYVNQYLQSVYIAAPGYYTLAAFLYVGTCFDVLNPAVVQSLAAYNYDERWSVLETDPAASAFQTNVAELLVILRSVLGADIGEPSNQPPYPNQAEAEESLTLIWQAVVNVCEGLELPECIGNLGQERVNGVSAVSDCWSQLLIGAAPLSSNPFRAAKVTHPPGQNFGITAAQASAASGSTDLDRRNFWDSRLSVSRDPAAPLARDIVDNRFLLGCLANQRYLAAWQPATVGVGLTQAGVDLMVAHVGTVNTDIQGLPGKLGARQIAQYHHTLFASYGLPARTFGGTPVTGSPLEADRTRFIWCPSCE